SSTCSTARSRYRYCARSWVPSARNTSGGIIPRFVMPRAERRKAMRSRRAWLRVRVIMKQGLPVVENQGDGAMSPAVLAGRSGRSDGNVARANRPRGPAEPGAGRVDLAVVKVEEDVAAGALGHCLRAVAGPAGIRHLVAAERAVHDQADVVGRG